MPTIRRKVSDRLQAVTHYPNETAEPVMAVKTYNARSNSRRLSLSRVIIGLCLLVSLLQLRGRSRVTTAPYAVCSYDRPAIYIVDADNSIAECIVVYGSTIVDSGSIGE